MGCRGESARGFRGQLQHLSAFEFRFWMGRMFAQRSKSGVARERQREAGWLGLPDAAVWMAGRNRGAACDFILLEEIDLKLPLLPPVRFGSGLRWPGHRGEVERGVLSVGLFFRFKVVNTTLIAEHTCQRPQPPSGFPMGNVVCPVLPARAAVPGQPPSEGPSVTTLVHAMSIPSAPHLATCSCALFIEAEPSSYSAPGHPASQPSPPSGPHS